MKNDNKQTRRRFLKATGGAATAAALAGCLGGGGDGDGNGNQSGGGGGGGNGNGGGGGGNGDGGDGGDGQQGGQQGQFKVDTSATFQQVSASITTLDPIAIADTASGTVGRQMFEGLMTYPDGKVTPKKLLAEDFTVSDDFLTYEFTIKQGAKFRNGKALTAQDFVYSWERLAASPNSQRAYFILDSLGVKHETITKDGDEVYKPNSMHLEAVDDSTLRFELNQPFHDTLEMLSYGSFAAIPEGIVGDIKGYEGKVPYNQFAKSPKGAEIGPFLFQKWQQGTEASVIRNENYHGEKATIAGIHWQVLTEPSARYNYAMNKNSDTISMPTPKYNPSKITIEGSNDFGGEFGTYGPLRNGETADYYRITPINTYYVGFNMEKVPKAVRKAFAYVANQHLFVDQVFKSRGDPAYHFTPPTIYPGGVKAAEQHAKKKYKYGYGESQPSGIQKARQVMEEAGYGPNNPFEINWTQYKSPAWLEMAKIFRQKLASAYVKMKIQQADFSTLITRGRKGQLEAYTLGWIADWPAPDNFLQLLYPPRTQTEKPNNLSYINWSPELDGTSAATKATQAFERIQENQAPTKEARQIRYDAYIEMEEANWEDVGFLNIYNGLSERLSYDWAKIEQYGGMGPSRQQKASVKISQQRP